MECRDIRDQLSEYLDNALSPREKVAIDEHLKSCGECATALGDLKRAIEHLKHLEEVETPAWMTGRIMTRVRGEAQPKKGLLQKLSYPLYRKLPVGAIATAAIALSTLYIFRAIEPEIKLASAPMQETATQPPLREGLHSQGGPEADNVVPISPPSAKESEGAPGEKKREPSQRAEHAAPLGEPAFLGDRREAPEVPAPRKQEKPLREQRTPAPASGNDVSAPSAGSLVKEEASREEVPAAARFKTSDEERKEGIRITILVEDVERAGKEIKRHISELGGKVVKEQPYGDRNIFTAEMSTERLKEFLERLKSIGAVKEGSADVLGAARVVGLTIEIAEKPHKRTLSTPH